MSYPKPKQRIEAVGRFCDLGATAGDRLRLWRWGDLPPEEIPGAPDSAVVDSARKLDGYGRVAGGLIPQDHHLGGPSGKRVVWGKASGRRK
ncbi:hypothetical protein [Candidatus Protofrankia californiensis]|uniref:hypothetical protein n=1 Tax=Candidatus Protofrankia californiensis TaxID=1839754 RepID=UPI001041B889|nr:hypothetical protein [Candidatus Protofrankia californiensis]